MEVLDSELLTEDAVDIALGIEDCHIAFANDDEAIATGNGIVGDTAGGISRDGVTGYDFAIDETKGAIGGDVAIDEVLDGTEVACVNASIVDAGISWVLKLTSVPSISKNSA